VPRPASQLRLPEVRELVHQNEQVRLRRNRDCAPLQVCHPQVAFKLAHYDPADEEFEVSRQLFCYKSSRRRQQRNLPLRREGFVFYVVESWHFNFLP